MFGITATGILIEDQYSDHHFKNQTTIGLVFIQLPNFKFGIKMPLHSWTIEIRNYFPPPFEYCTRSIPGLGLDYKAHSEFKWSKALWVVIGLNSEQLKNKLLH